MDLDHSGIRIKGCLNPDFCVDPADVLFRFRMQGRIAGITTDGDRIIWIVECHDDDLGCVIEISPDLVNDLREI